MLGGGIPSVSPSSLAGGIQTGLYKITSVHKKREKLVQGMQEKEHNLQCHGLETKASYIQYNVCTYKEKRGLHHVASGLHRKSWVRNL